MLGSEVASGGPLLADLFVADHAAREDHPRGSLRTHAVALQLGKRGLHLRGALAGDTRDLGDRERLPTGAQVPVRLSAVHEAHQVDPDALRA